jgi:DNA-binding transcriptional ArsR family regulator
MHDNIANFTMPGEAEVERAVDTLRILGDPTRLRIVWALTQGESSVACLADLAGANPTAVSQHLAKLRLAGVVKARREGNFMYYSAVSTEISKILDAIFVDDVATGRSRHARKPRSAPRRVPKLA